MATELIEVRTKAELCQLYKSLDKEYNTERDSPLHHDNRCRFHKKRGS